MKTQAPSVAAKRVMSMSTSGQTSLWKPEEELVPTSQGRESLLRAQHQLLLIG